MEAVPVQNGPRSTIPEAPPQAGAVSASAARVQASGSAGVRASAPAAGGVGARASGQVSRAASGAAPGAAPGVTPPRTVRGPAIVSAQVAAGEATDRTDEASRAAIAAIVALSPGEQALARAGLSEDPAGTDGAGASHGIAGRSGGTAAPGDAAEPEGAAETAGAPSTAGAASTPATSRMAGATAVARKAAGPVNLLGLDRKGFLEFCAGLGEKPFRAQQLMRWVHQRGVSDWSAMTDLARVFRERLQDQALIRAPGVLKDHTARDSTRKWLFDVGGGNAVEAVFIPEARRGTLCVSSQAGCAVNCSFCSTGKQGFSRNLNTAEILGQIWLANQLLRQPGAQPRWNGSDDMARMDEDLDDGGAERPISNIVFMGMGEPLLNYGALLPALRVLLDDHAYGLSRRRVTVSTSGVVPLIDRLSDDCPVALAVSLHASNDTLRDQLVPLNRKYPLKELLAACQRYLKVAPRDFITFEYVMLNGINDTVKHAHELVSLVADVPCKFNLIPFNPFPNSGLNRSSDRTIRQFSEELLRAGIVTTVRRTRGNEIDAACGQLAGEVVDRTRLRERTVRIHRPEKVLATQGAGA